MDEVKTETAKLSSPIELIQKSFEIFFKKENFIYFLKIYSLLIPFEIFFIYQNSFIESQSKILNITNPSLILAKYPNFLTTVIIVNIIYFLVSFLTSSAGIIAILNIIKGKRLNIKNLYKFTWRKLAGISLVGILVFLAVFGGFLLLFVPGFIFAIWFYFAEYVYLDQNSKVKESLVKSKELVKGKFWAVTGRLFVFGLIIGLLSSLISILPYLGAIIISLFGALNIIPSFLLYKELVSSRRSI